MCNKEQHIVIHACMFRIEKPQNSYSVIGSSAMYSYCQCVNHSNSDDPDATTRTVSGPMAMHATSTQQYTTVHADKIKMHLHAPVISYHAMFNQMAVSYI